VVVAGVVAVQFLLVVRAYWSDHDQFGFQMFPESSQWQADVYRVDADGDRHDVGDAWPGGYRWGDLVVGRGLGNPFVRSHADTGLDSTLDFFGDALDWVARNTPDDLETAFLEAEVTTWHNGRDPEFRVMRSVTRSEARR
jgi:hypothetical protein